MEIKTNVPEKRVASKKYKGVYSLKQKDGDISYSILYKNAEGKNQREAIGLKSEGITLVYAHNKRVERINAIKHGEDPLAHKKKRSFEFKDVWDFYTTNKAMTENNRKDYIGRWNKHMSEYFSKLVTMESLIKFRKAKEALKKKEALSARSIDMMIGMIGSAISYWNSQPQNKLKVHNAVTDLRTYDRDHLTSKQKKKRKVERDRFLTQEEIKILKTDLQGREDELTLFLLISLSTGARLGTVMTIADKDISENKVSLIDHKRGSMRYTATLNNEVMKLIEAIDRKMEPDESIFLLSEEAIQKRLQRRMNDLFNKGLDSKDSVHRCVIHSLRHTFASHLAIKGVPLTTIKKLLNHSSITTTERYAHLLPDAGADAVMELWN
jgi:integrase